MSLTTIFSTRTNYWKNGTQFIGRIPSRIMGEHKYEFWRLEKRIFYARFWYHKQAFLLKVSIQAPDVANAFSMLAKMETGHGFPVFRPYERNSDVALFNLNSEGWFQCFAFMAANVVIFYWLYLTAGYFIVGSGSIDDEDNYKLKDAKTSMLWERTFWSLTYTAHGQHMSALQKAVKYSSMHPDDPKLNAKASFNNKNPYAPDRYYRGFGNMMDMRCMYY